MDLQKKRNVRYAVPQNSAQQERYVSSVMNSCRPRNFTINAFECDSRGRTSPISSVTPFLSHAG